MKKNENYCDFIKIKSFKNNINLKNRRQERRTVQPTSCTECSCSASCPSGSGPPLLTLYNFVWVFPHFFNAELNQ